MRLQWLQFGAYSLADGRRVRAEAEARAAHLMNNCHRCHSGGPCPCCPPPLPVGATAPTHCAGCGKPITPPPNNS